MLLAKRIRTASRNSGKITVYTDSARRSSEPCDYPSATRNKQDMNYSSVSLTKRKQTLITLKKSNQSMSVTDETERSNTRSPRRRSSRDNQHLLNSWSGPNRNKALTAFQMRQMRKALLEKSGDYGRDLKHLSLQTSTVHVIRLPEPQLESRKGSSVYGSLELESTKSPEP